MVVCRIGLTGASQRILTPSDVVDSVLVPLKKEQACSSAFLQAVGSQFEMAGRAHGIRMPVSLDLFVLECILDQVCVRARPCG